MMLPIQYAEHPPPDVLAETVRDLWSFTASDAVKPGTFTLPPDPCTSLAVVQMGPRVGLRIVGPHLEPLNVPVGPGSRVRGVRFLPDAAGRVLGIDPSAWPDRNEAAETVVPELAERVCASSTVDAGREALLDALAERVRYAPPPDALVRASLETIEALRGELRVSELATDLAVSPRTLQRRFRAATGLSPKRYARVRRFLMAVSNVIRDDPDPWGRVAAEFGYADQAHFVRECVALTGMPPTGFADRMAPIQHIDVRP
ncbi:MAG: helix-turn-helix domain-containing protein [Bacteroidota bacterium]